MTNILKSKKAQLEIMVFVIIAVVLVVGSYVGTKAIDKNIKYIGDSRIKQVFPTDNCLEHIKQIPQEYRVAFGSLEDIERQQYTLIPYCPD